MPPRPAGGRGVQAPPASHDPEGERIEELPGVDVSLHPIGINFASQSDVKLIGFLINKSFFHQYPSYAESPTSRRAFVVKDSNGFGPGSASTSPGLSTTQTRSRT